MDNAANNATMMASLETMLGQHDITFDAVDCQIMCFAHIIDLCSKQVTRSVSNRVDDDDTDSLYSGDETVEFDPIARARDIVRVIRGSSKRRQAFEDVIKNGNSGDWFRDGQPPKVVKVESQQLLRDVRTRWDSVFLMLRRLRQLRPV